jgi:nucleoid-associated protein YgaU
MAPGQSQSVQRAELEIEGQGTVPCLFNPQSYTVSKANVYSVRPVVGSSLPKPQFAGGQPRTLSLELLLDVTLTRPARSSVRPITDQLFKMMEVASSGPNAAPGAAPPTVTFRWGAVETFKAVPTHLEVQYVLFKPDGEPARAWVRLELLQAQTADSRSSSTTPRAQNPTTRADALQRRHVVTQGDSLASIAWQSYGDATRWRAIAEANGIDDPMALTPGRTLTVPSLSA